MLNRIYELRRARGLTQSDLAELTGVGPPQVSRWEKGLVDIPMSKLELLAQCLNVSVDDLFPPEDPFPLNEVYLANRPEVIARDAALATAARLTKAREDEAATEGNATPFKMDGASDDRMREDLPVYGTALGAAREIDGEAIEQTTLNTGEVVHYAKRPPILNGNAAAYGLYVAGSSMDPRFRDGEMLLADPKGRVRAGEDVIVYLRPKNGIEDNGDAARGVLVKTLVRRTSTCLELEQFSPPKVFRVEMEEVVRVDRVIPWQELIG